MGSVPNMTEMSKEEQRFAAAARAISEAAMPRLMARSGQLRAAGFEPIGAMLPASMDPGKYEGPGATDIPATIMGLPIVWGDEFGIVVRA